MPETEDWDTWQSGAYEYQRFSSSEYDMALTGPYQLVVRDAWLSLRPQADEESLTAKIDDFFAQRPQHEDNAMTGLLAGKNLILIQLESVDDFVLNDENTPTLFRLQQEGISFTEFYTPPIFQRLHLQHGVCGADRALSLRQRQRGLYLKPQRLPLRHGESVCRLYRQLLPQK